MGEDIADKIAEDIITAAPNKESADWVRSAIDSGKIIIMS
jgi:hypothetical protein